MKGHTDEELLHWATNLMKLHKKLGHPSSQALVKMLRDRGATTKMLTLAGNLHCLDCEEARMRRPHGRAVTLKGAERLWEVVQMDNMEFTFGKETYRWQVMIDEASGYANATFLFKHGENPTTQQILTNVMQSWVQYFGFPQKIKLDKKELIEVVN